MSNNDKKEAVKPGAADAPKRKDGTVFYDDGKGGVSDKAPVGRPHKRRSLDGKVAAKAAKGK